ncbi:hypothetical protein B0H12DRAFT_1145121 [Mycena haematopus]|nr:hypothetical protein B0H12DRAFT_1145121 [Mycena haematopus]
MHRVGRRGDVVDASSIARRSRTNQKKEARGMLVRTYLAFARSSGAFVRAGSGQGVWCVGSGLSYGVVQRRGICGVRTHLLRDWIEVEVLRNDEGDAGAHDCEGIATRRRARRRASHRDAADGSLVRLVKHASVAGARDARTSPKISLFY